MSRRHMPRIATAVAMAVFIAWGLADTATNLDPSLAQVVWTALAGVVLLAATVTVLPGGDQR